MQTKLHTEDKTQQMELHQQIIEAGKIMKNKKMKPKSQSPKQGEKKRKRSPILIQVH